MRDVDPPELAGHLQVYIMWVDAVRAGELLLLLRVCVPSCPPTHPPSMIHSPPHPLLPGGRRHAGTSSKCRRGRT